MPMSDEPRADFTLDYLLAAVAAARAEEHARFLELIVRSEGDMDMLKFLLERNPPKGEL